MPSSTQQSDTFFPTGLWEGQVGNTPGWLSPSWMGLGAVDVNIPDAGLTH